MAAVRLLAVEIARKQGFVRLSYEFATSHDGFRHAQFPSDLLESSILRPTADCTTAVRILTAVARQSYEFLRQPLTVNQAMQFSSERRECREKLYDSRTNSRDNFDTNTVLVFTNA